MPLGTIDRSPPPFFRQGPSALTQVVFFTALSVFCMVADLRFKVAQPVRAALATALLPIQRSLQVPLEIWQGGGDYLRGLRAAQAAESDARARLAQQALRAAQVDALLSENQRLRALLGLAPTLQVRSNPAEVLFEAADPFSRKVFLSRGSTHGVLLGSPVITDAGVVGQVTRVYPLTSEVTLLADKEAAVPVINARTQARSAAHGGASDGGMELRFMAGNADVQVGDLLVTSGLDAVYPPGLAVAKVSKIERRVESGFARIALTPVAPPDGVRHVLVLEPLSTHLPPRPQPEPELEVVKPSRAEKLKRAKAASAASAASSGGRKP